MDTEPIHYQYLLPVYLIIHLPRNLHLLRYMRHLQFSFRDGASFLCSSCSSSLYLSQFSYFQTDELKHNCRNPQMDVTLLIWYHHVPFSVKKFSPSRIALFFSTIIIIYCLILFTPPLTSTLGFVSTSVTSSS